MRYNKDMSEVDELEKLFGLAEENDEVKQDETDSEATGADKSDAEKAPQKLEALLDRLVREVEERRAKEESLRAEVYSQAEALVPDEVYSREVLDIVRKLTHSLDTETLKSVKDDPSILVKQAIGEYHLQRYGGQVGLAPEQGAKGTAGEQKREYSTSRTAEGQGAERAALPTSGVERPEPIGGFSYRTAPSEIQELYEFYRRVGKTDKEIQEILRQVGGSYGRP